MKNILEILKGFGLLIALFFGFVFIFNLTPLALAFSLPSGSHIYHYEPISVCTKGTAHLGQVCSAEAYCIKSGVCSLCTKEEAKSLTACVADAYCGAGGLCSPGQSYKLGYYTEYNLPSTTGCSANKCYDAGTCYNPGVCLANYYQRTCIEVGIGVTVAKGGVCLKNSDCGSGGICSVPTDKLNQSCLLGSWRNSCGNGIVEGACGEQCEYTGGGNYCDQTFGERNWYKGNDISIKCGSDCRWSGSSSFTQNDCGGFCGDGQLQTASGEQCDIGIKTCVKGSAKQPKIGDSCTSDNKCGIGGICIPSVNICYSVGTPICSSDTDCGGGGICLGTVAAGAVTNIYNGGLGGSNVDSQYLCDNKCKSSGGFCGDGLIQKFCSKDQSRSCTKDSDCIISSINKGPCSGGEQCDWFNYNTPIPDSSSAANQYKCQNTNPALKSGPVLACQSTGGFCGDGQLQKDFKEECDDGTTGKCADTTIACANDTACSGGKKCIKNTGSCGNNCKNTYCGDRFTQSPNGLGEKGRQVIGKCSLDNTITCSSTIPCPAEKGNCYFNFATAAAPGKGYEICDDGADNGAHGFCADDCSGQNIGGLCNSNNACAQGLKCEAINSEVSGIQGICRGQIGAAGCAVDGDCSTGYYCDKINSTIPQCRLYTAIFLRDHSVGNVAAIALKADCPKLKSINNTDFLDDCTGLIWSKADYSKSISAGVTDPLFSFGAVCPDPYRVPTTRELLSLVSYFKANKPLTGAVVNNDINLGTGVYTANKNCPIQCVEDSTNNPGFCKKSNNTSCGLVDAYIYWASDTFGANSGYAVNFGSGSAEVYPKNYLLRLRCVK